MKDKTTAAILALFLGWFGIHRFYLKQGGLGILYIFLFFAFGISVILGIIDAIVLLAMDQEDFDRRHNSDDGRHRHEQYRRRDLRREYQQRRRESEKKQRPSKIPRNVKVPERQKVNPYKQNGIKKYKDFDLEGAIEDFEKGLEISPKDIALHFNLACAYSLTEKPDKSYYHIDQAVKYGFNDFEKIKTHDDLAFMRIQENFEEFEKNGFRLEVTSKLEAPKENLLDQDILLEQLNRLSELRKKGLITEDEFTAEKKKLLREE